jgi:hypothetical protein
VISAWELAEESSSAAQGREAQQNFNWLNIGYFDSGAGAIAFNHAFQDPVSAAEQTANFLKGTWGGASPGIRAILDSVGQSPQAQMTAIANSGWASSGYNGGANLEATYRELSPGLTIGGSGAMSSDAPAQVASGGQAVPLGVPGVSGTTGSTGAARMLAAAQAVTGSTYSQANHNAVLEGAGQIHLHGTDCSGFVSYLMGPHGLGVWSQSYVTPEIPTAPDIQTGEGSSITIWNNPNPGDAGHVFIKILGRYFESAGSTGVHEMDQSEVNMYLQSGLYKPLHPAGM